MRMARMADLPEKVTRKMKRAMVCGAGGFIGGHLVKKLKGEGYWVRGVDIKEHEFSRLPADEFALLDLREPQNCRRALEVGPGTFDEVYQLAAAMGGMGYIHSAECEIMHDNVLINTHMTHHAAEMGVKRYFYSSSVCVYRDMQPGEPEMHEAEAVPANPENEYGWEKLYSERLALAYGRKYPMAVRIARFQNCYGAEGTWRGGREKAPAAMCRKVAEVENGGTVEMWGDGSAIRSYTHVDDMVDGVFRLMHSDLEGVANIGFPQYVSVNQAAGDGGQNCRQAGPRQACRRSGRSAVPQLQQRPHRLHRLEAAGRPRGGHSPHLSVD